MVGYVHFQVYLHPDPSKATKRKTKVVRKNCHPSFMEMVSIYEYTHNKIFLNKSLFELILRQKLLTFIFQLEYRMPIDVVKCRTLQATLWDCGTVWENMFLGAVTIPLETFFSDSDTHHGVDKQVIGVTSSMKVESWYPLTNFHRMTTLR